MLLSRFHSRTKEDNESLGDEIFRNREAPAFFFRWRFEISNVEITDDEPEEDMVVCCECRGTTVATEPFSLSKSRAGQLQSVLGFDTILYSKSTLLDGDVETFFASTRGEGTSKDSLSCFFASFVVRLAVRTKTSTGELVDCMALDLCTLAAQSESGKDHKLELQLGGEICTRIVCNRLGRVDAQNHAVKDESQPRVSTPQVDRIDSAASAESPSDERMAGYFNTFRSLSLELYDSEGGTQERSDWGDKASLSSPERLSMVSTCSEQDRSPLAKEANFDGTDSFSQDFGLEIEEASSSPDLPHGSLDPRDDSHKTTAASESGSDEGDGSVPNRIVVTTHPLTPLVTARFSHQEYRLRADTPASERPVTTHVQTPKPLVMWSIQGPEPAEDEDSDEDIDARGDGGEVSKRKIDKLRSAWWYLDRPGKGGLPAAAGKVSSLQLSMCWYAQRESPTPVALNRPSPTFGSNATVLRAAATLPESGIVVPEPCLSDGDSNEGTTSCDTGRGEANMAGDEEFVQDWSEGPGSEKSDASSTVSGKILESEGLEVPEDSEFYLRMAKLQQRISTLNEEKVASLEQARAVSLESDSLEAECQDLRSKLKFATESEQIQLEDENQSAKGMNQLLLRTMRLKLAGEVKLRQLRKESRLERQDLRAKAAELEKLEKEKCGSSDLDLARERERLQRVVDSLQEEISRQHGVEKHLHELRATKSDLAVVRAENEKLQLEIAKIRSVKESSWNVFARC